MSNLWARNINRWRTLLRMVKLRIYCRCSPIARFLPSLLKHCILVFLVYSLTELPYVYFSDASVNSLWSVGTLPLDMNLVNGLTSDILLTLTRLAGLGTPLRYPEYQLTAKERDVLYPPNARPPPRPQQVPEFGKRGK